MRILTILLLALVLAACCPKTLPVPTSEAEISREAELLIHASLTDRLMQNTEAYYRDQTLAMLTAKEVPLQEAERMVDSALKQLITTEHQRLVDALVTVYLRFYTAEEIHQLLSFYQTEVARKSIRVSPQIAAESREYVRLWGENFGEKLLEQVAAEPGGN